MEKLTTDELIQELINRGAIKIINKSYSCKKVYIEERYTTYKHKIVPKEVLILDKVI